MYLHEKAIGQPTSRGTYRSFLQLENIQKFVAKRLLHICQARDLAASVWSHECMAVKCLLLQLLTHFRRRLL